MMTIFILRRLRRVKLFGYKSDCQLLLRSLDDLPIYLGESKSKFGMNTFHIFLLENEPRWEKASLRLVDT